MPNDQQLSNESIKYLKSRPKSERSVIGQFLTPKMLRDELLAQVPLEPGMRVLDPGVGTGEFLASCLNKCPRIEAFGWDIDGPALDVARQVSPTADLTLRSALDDWNGEKFDVVIGNPPYYEMKNLSTESRVNFKNVISGRPNIFALFFEVGYRVLRDGGYLAYVVPPSMNNGAYFEKLRDFLLRNFSIEFLKVFENPFLFDEVQTSVQLIVLRKSKTSKNHWVNLSELCESPIERKIFVQDTISFKNMYAKRSSLRQLGYKASTGGVVWNTQRNELTNTLSDDVIPLIWAHNITAEGQIILNALNEKKPQYINKRKSLEGPAIVVNRITGSVGSGSLRCALIPERMEFVAENHVNVITRLPNAEQKISWEKLLESLRRPDVNARVRLITGNTQLSATELTNWVPLDTDAH